MTERDEERAAIAAYVMEEAMRWRKKSEQAEMPEVTARMDAASIALATIALDIERGAHLKSGGKRERRR